ncbi:hypothetical protein RCO27_18320 [Sphingosinicella sp. LHD-64]|uniref:hypothetical protein n=1 Tax=Sphingosinicella sp. LHD-64 TaxID=3072139 RepID=UPI00280DDE9A|nr:hypothetical protein [Sphingosinicella sp. LHD-64]MDQ8758187.1 hypothetical protein [Sphingosinicella sp. LHD-64]
MLDGMEGRMWADHHDQFGKWVDGAIGAIGAALRLGFSRGSTVPGQLLSIAGAVGVTLLTLGATAA